MAIQKNIETAQWVQASYWEVERATLNLRNDGIKKPSYKVLLKWFLDKSAKDNGKSSLESKFIFIEYIDEEVNSKISEYLYTKLLETELFKDGEIVE